MGTVYRLTPHLQGLGRQPDCDPAGVVRQPASGGNPVSCMWRACHVPLVVCVLISPTRRRLMGTVYRLTPHLQGLELEPVAV